MLPSCPQCGSTRSRLSRAQNRGEQLGSLVGRYPLRCRDCQTRYIGSFSRLKNWREACCPRCYRTRLTTWDEEYYRPKLWQRIRLTLGAKPVRCDVCRLNFTSFLRVRGEPAPRGEAALLGAERDSSAMP